mgnify:CR=1 FL=1
MNDLIDLQSAFTDAEATTPFDQLLLTLQLTIKSVKAERDRLDKDAQAGLNFTAAVTKISDLSKQLQKSPHLIDDYLDAATEMRRATTTRNARVEKSESQWPAINQCWAKAEHLLADLNQPALDIKQAA